MATHVHRLTISGRFLGQSMQSVLHFMPTTTVGLPDPSVIGLALHNAVRVDPTAGDSLLGRYIKSTTAGYSFEHTSVVIYPWTASPVPYLSFDSTLPLATLTQPAAPALPPSVAAVIKRRSNVARRWAMARTFMPAVPASGVVDGKIPDVNAYRDLLNLLLVRMLAFITGTWQTGQPTTTYMPITVRKGQVDPVDGGPVINKLQTGSLDSVVRSQRRREIGVGI